MGDREEGSGRKQVREGQASAGGGGRGCRPDVEAGLERRAVQESGPSFWITNGK